MKKHCDPLTSCQRHITSRPPSAASSNSSSSAGTCQTKHWGVQSTLRNISPGTDQFSLWSASLTEMRVCFSAESATLKQGSFDILLKYKNWKMVFFRVIKCHFHFYKKARVLVYTESYTANSCWINVSGPEIDAISALPSVIEANKANRLVLLNKAPSQRENFLLAAGAAEPEPEPTAALKSGPWSRTCELILLLTHTCQDTDAPSFTNSK